MARASGSRGGLGAGSAGSRRRRRRRAGSGGAASVSTTSTLSSLAVGVARQVAAVGHRQRAGEVELRESEELGQRTRFSRSGSVAASVPPDAGRRVAALALSGSEYFGGLGRHLGVFDLAEAVDQALPLVRLEQLRRTGLRGRAP